MDGFFGIFARTDTPIDPEHLALMAAALPWYDRERGGQWITPSAALGHLTQGGTPEAQDRPQPIARDGGRLIFCGEARIDNRADLLARLEIAPAQENPISDADLILAAYTRWGEDCPAYLIGDYAFAVWDDQAHKMVCVRDALGPVPLYYHLSSQWLIFSNQIRAVAAHPAVSNRLDDDSIATHLALTQYVLPTTTFLADVKKLQPARVLAVSPTREDERIFWKPETVAPFTLSDREEYIARFRELLDTAIADRLRTTRQVAAHVSGGLDSTSIAAIALPQLRAQGKELFAYHWIPTPRPEDDADAPELAAIRRALEFLNVPAENVDLTPAALVEMLDQDIALDGYSNLWYEPLVRAKAKARDVGVILSGWGGDEVVTAGNNGYYAELLQRGRWMRLARLLARQCDPGWQGYKQFGERFLRRAIKPHLPNFLLARHNKSSTEMTLLPSLSPAPGFLSTLKQQHPPRFRAAPALHKTQIEKLNLGHLAARMETWAIQGARDGIRYTYPLLDRRLVEFCLGMPADVFVDDTYVRGFFRAVMAGRLPDDIRLTLLKFEPLRVSRYSEAMIQACQDWLCAAQSDERWNDPVTRAATNRYVDTDRFFAFAQHKSTTSAESKAALTDLGYGDMLALYRQIQVLNTARNHYQ